MMTANAQSDSSPRESADAVSRWRHLLVQQAAEFRVCMSRGATRSDRARLVADGLRFHLGNRLRRPADFNHCRTYRVRLASKDVDLAMRHGAGDFFVFHEIFTSSVYAIPGEWISRIETIVDLGAHIGLTALYFLELMPQARIVSVEAAPDNAKVLRSNLSHFNERALVIEAAVASTNGFVFFEQEGWSWGRGVKGSPSSRAVRVPSVNVDEVIERAQFDRIGLLKVDIEGAEKDLFSGSPEWLERVAAIVIELHSPYDINQFSADVGRAGFRILWPAEGQGNRMVMAVRNVPTRFIREPLPGA